MWEHVLAARICLDRKRSELQEIVRVERESKICRSLQCFFFEKEGDKRPRRSAAPSSGCGSVVELAVLKSRVWGANKSGIYILIIFRNFARFFCLLGFFEILLKILLTKSKEKQVEKQVRYRK